MTTLTFIILHFVIGLIVATIEYVLEGEDDPISLAATVVVWELLVCGVIFLLIGYVIGQLPKYLGKKIKELIYGKSSGK